jgi:dUTP pyrophosphatase
VLEIGWRERGKYCSGELESLQHFHRGSLLCSVFSKARTQIVEERTGFMIPLFLSMFMKKMEKGRRKPEHHCNQQESRQESGTRNFHGSIIVICSKSDKKARRNPGWTEGCLLFSGTGRPDLLACFRHSHERKNRVKDLLSEIWEMQRDLNRYTLKQNEQGIDYDEIPKNRHLQNEWVQKYSLAMSQEISELVDSTNWKWWRTKVDLFDEQNLKVELVDILHFWVSACQVMGLSAEDVHRMYMQKNEVNRKRQDDGYLVKDESDNRGIG